MNQDYMKFCKNIITLMFFLLLGVNSYPQNNKKNISTDYSTDYNIVSSNNSYI